MKSIYRYIQIGVYIRGYQDKVSKNFVREIAEVTEFYVTEETEPKSNTLYKKTPDGRVTLHNPSKYLLAYLESQGVIMPPDTLVKEEFKPMENNTNNDYRVDESVNNTQYSQLQKPMVNQNYQQPYRPQAMQPVVTNLNNQQMTNQQLMHQNQIHDIHL